MTSPFDKAKYRALLEGLEAVEILLSEAQKDNDTGRLDNGYFTKDYLKLKDLSKGWCSLHNYAKQVVCGPFGSTVLNDSYVEDGIPMIRPFNLRGMQTEHENIAYLREVDITSKGLKVFDQETLLFARVGDIGCGILTYPRATISPNVIAVPLKRKEYNPYYATVFFNTHYGRLQMEGAVKAVAQPTISTDSIRDLKIPEPSITLSNTIETLFKKSLILSDTAQDDYRKAEQTLLRALGLENWQPPEVLTYERKSTDVFAAGRLDAEHFQPKYDELIRKLSRVNNVDLRPIKDFSEPLKYGTSEKLVYEVEGIPFLRIADLDNKRFNTQSVQYISKNQVANISDRVSLGDVLVSRSGTLGVAVPITEPFNNAIFGSYFIRTRPDHKIIHPEFMSLFINSLAGQLQVKQKNTGGVQMNLTIEAIENICIPIGNLGWQQSFVDLVEQSLAARKQARFLLDQAKRAVETAIEENEDAAMAFLRQSQEASL